MFEPHELEFLRANELPRQRWLGSDNAAPIIKDLIARGLMRPASGEFGKPIDRGEKASVFGKTLPIMELVSLYQLTPTGQAAYEEPAPKKEESRMEERERKAATPVPYRRGLL